MRRFLALALATALTGCSAVKEEAAAEQAVGRPISLVIPADRVGEERQIMARLQAGERVEHFDTVRVRRDGRPIQVSLTISPIKDAAGQLAGASKIAHDITGASRSGPLFFGLKS